MILKLARLGRSLDTEEGAQDRSLEARIKHGLAGYGLVLLLSVVLYPFMPSESADSMESERALRRAAPANSISDLAAKVDVEVDIDESGAVTFREVPVESSEGSGWKPSADEEAEILELERESRQADQEDPAKRFLDGLR